MKRFSAFLVAMTLLLTSVIATPALAAPWKFAVLCDSRSGYASDPVPIIGPDGTSYPTATSSPYYDATNGISPYFKNVAAALAKETGIDFVLYPGDLARGKKPVPSDAAFAANLQEWLNQWSPVTNAGIPTYYVRGNHDAINATTAPAIWTGNIPVPVVNPLTMDVSQTGLTYSFTHKGSLFVGFDEYPNGTGATGYDKSFLTSQLAKQAQHKFVFAHQPVWNFKADELGPAGLADDLNNGGVDLYFSGHVHSYQRIAEQGYNFQEMIIGTGGAPQDNPTLAGVDPKLSVKAYAGGAGTNAKFGYAIITVNDDGSISTEMKFLDDPASSTSTVSSFDQNTIKAKPWKFGVMSDTQWPTSPDSKNPNVAVNVIRHLNPEFIKHGTKFVIQVGDLDDTVGTNNINLDVRATFAQDLYNAGIGFFPLRGNHESSAAAAVRFQQIFPQTQTGVNNQTPNMVGSTIYGPQANTNTTFSVGTNFSTEPTFEGLTYSFDYNNARFVLTDQFTKPAGTAHANLDATDVSWIGGQFASRPANTHAFSFAHKGLVTENHADNLFNSTNPTASQPSKDLMETFMGHLQNNGVRYHMGGHDHMHNRAIVSSPNTGNFKVQNIIAASNSYKFYIPPYQNVFTTQSPFRNLEQPIAQELFTVGYYIFTVDGPKVTVDHYAMPNGCNGDCDQTTDVIPYAGNTPTANGNYQTAVPFTKHDSFGYSLNGKEFMVAQGGSYILTDDTSRAVSNGETGYRGTSAAILSGTNGSTATDYNLRPLTKSVNTGWYPAESGLASDVFTLWGMQDSLATQLTPLNQASPQYSNYTYAVPDTTHTDTYVLSMDYDPAVSDVTAQSGLFGLAVRDRNGNWENAVMPNSGGTKQFVDGPWNSGYTLGTYGVDTTSHTAWAVINHNSDFAVTTFSTFTTTVTPGGTVPAGKTATITSVPAGINCTWNGSVSSGTCTASNLTDGIQVVLNAALPAGTTVAWGAGCDSTTTTSCTINSLVANTTISATFTATAVAPAYLNIQTVTGNSVYLIAAPSSTPGAIYNFLYNKDGAGWVAFGTPSSTRNPTLTLPDPGVYQFQVYVTANGYTASPTTTTVGSVSNTAAIAPAYLNIQTFNAAASSVYLISAPSSTPGAVYNFEYNKDGLGWTPIGTPSATRNPTFILPAGPGSYQFRVFITANGYTSSPYRATTGSATVLAPAAAPAYLNVQSFNAATGATYLISAPSLTPGALYSFQYRQVGNPTWTDFSVASPVRNPTITVGSGTWEFQVIITAPNGYIASAPKAANITVTR